MRHFVSSTLAVACLLFAAPVVAGSKPVEPAPINIDAPPTAAFTDSTAAGLAGTKRVAITSVIVAFQSSTGAIAGPGMFFRMFQSKDEVLSVMAIPGMNSHLQDDLAESAYLALVTELKAQGFEIVPQSQIAANANYQAIIQRSGYANHSRFANAMGDVEFVGPEGLATYMPYQGELGPFHFPSKTYLGWTSGMGGKSMTPGGPSIISMADAWKVPGFEVALAKELNANVVKAFYVVSLGKADAKRKTSFSTSQHSGLFTSGGNLYSGNYTTLDRTITGTGQAFAQVGLVADQSRIAFRTPTGNAKWQKVPATKMGPAKDGDVVVRLAEPIIGSTDYFSVHQGDLVKRSGFLSGTQKGDINLNFVARISDPVGYGKEVTGMIEAANHAMLGLVKQ